MKLARSHGAALLAVAIVAGVTSAQQGTATADLSCRVCHPGPTQGLRHSIHSEIEGHGCAACHGDLTTHVRAAGQGASGGDAAKALLAVAPVAAASCSQCHEGARFPTSRAAHGLAAASPATSSSQPQRAGDDALVRALQRGDQRPSLLWKGLVDVGYRFVDVDGSRDGYATDVDLHSGLRVRTFEATGAGSSSSALDEVGIRGHDLGDPRRDLDAHVRDRDVGEVEAEWHEGRYRYRGEGDFHRVDRESERMLSRFDLRIDDNVSLFGSFQRFDEDGYWLTQRIGNQNLSLQSYVDGVDSPRHAVGTDSELGLSSRGSVFTFRAAMLYHDESARDSWTYTQPATANPLFTESENFTSRTSLRGPGATALLRADLDEVQVEASVRHFDRERGITAFGTTTGFDVAEFTSDIDASGGGHARTWLVDLDGSMQLERDLRLRCDLHWRDHGEDLALQQTDTTVYPTLPSTVVVATNVSQRTGQRMIDGNALLEWAASKSLDLGVGYGFSREWLRVPDVDPLDPLAYRSGRQRDDGVMADVHWRPAAGWTARAEIRDYATDGALLHELTPERARQVAASVQVQGQRARSSVFVRHRRNENDIAQHRLDAITAGLTAGLDLVTGLALSATYTFARTDMRTLTSFYFDPDPNPAPTIVGFQGDTNTVTSGLQIAPSADVRWNLSGAWTDTRGDFDVTTLDWRCDLRLLLAGERSAVGTEFRCSRYEAEGGLRDWDARSLFVYWQQRF
jgi:hypothetical protein